MENFAEKFKAARNAAGMTQQGVEDQMQIPRRTVQDWEKGLMTPPPYVQRLVLNELESKKPGERTATETEYKVFGLTPSGTWRGIMSGWFRSLEMAERFVSERRAADAKRAQGTEVCKDYKIKKRTVSSTATEWEDV